MKLLKEFQAIFLDFDGVIKDSVEIKSNAFEQLFLPSGYIVISLKLKKGLHTLKNVWQYYDEFQLNLQQFLLLHLQ